MSQTAVPPVPTLPQQAPPPAPPAPPAPVATPYEETWSKGLSLDPPLRLAATKTVVVVAGSTSVVARSLDDGHDLWTQTFHHVTALASDDAHVLVGADRSLSAYDPATGTKQWTTAETGDPDAIVDQGGWILTTAGSALAALRLDGGTIVWREVLGPAFVGAPALDGPGVFAVLADGRLLGLALGTGEVEWTSWLDDASSGAYAANDLVYLSMNDGGFEAYKQRDGHFSWRYPGRAPAIGTPLCDGSHVYIALQDNTVQALDRDVGNQRWQAQLTERPVSGPLLDSGNVLVASSSGEVQLVRPRDGRTEGHLAAPTAPAGIVNATPRLAAITVAPVDRIIRLVENGDTSLTLGVYHRKPKDAKGKGVTR